MSINCIEIIGLSYENTYKDFSIAFEDTKFISFTGPNNCGKTTLIKILDGQLPINNTILLYNKRLEEYKITELNNLIKVVIPKEITFIQNTIEEELYYQLPQGFTKEQKNKIIKDIAKRLNLTKKLTKSVENLSSDEIIKTQIALAMINKPKIIVIDDLSLYISKKELSELYNELKKYNEQEKITIITMTTNLDNVLKTDYIYVINNSEIIIEGNPKEVLEKDNIINKAGLELPFMMDLSVKLRDYDLIKDIELDMDRMVNLLWK